MMFEKVLTREREARKQFAKALLDPLYIPDLPAKQDSLYQALSVMEETQGIFRNDYDGD